MACYRGGFMYDAYSCVLLNVGEKIFNILHHLVLENT